jgi:predicted transposase YdaD
MIHPQRIALQLSPIYLENIATAKLEGKAEGRQEGKAEGRVQGWLEMTIELIQDKFGDLPTSVQVRVESLDLEQLRSLGKSLKDFKVIDDLVAWLDALA